MLKKVEGMEKIKNLTFYDLDDFLKPFFFDEAREIYRKTKKVDEIELAKLTHDDLIREYADNLKLSKSIIHNALNQAKIYCNKYIETRDSLALINAFRVDIQFGSFSEIRSHPNHYE